MHKTEECNSIGLHLQRMARGPPLIITQTGCNVMNEAFKTQLPLPSAFLSIRHSKSSFFVPDLMTSAAEDLKPLYGHHCNATLDPQIFPNLKLNY
jgi:hypothetical protein